MRPNTARWVAWLLGIVSMALLAGALGLFLIDRGRITLPESVGGWSLLRGFDIAANIGVPILGVLIAARRPENPIGWLFLAGGLALGLSAFGQLYAIHALLVEPGFLPGGHLMGWLSTCLLPVAICLLPFLFLLFPTGRLPSRRWRLVAWFSAVVLACLTTSAIVFATANWADPFAGSEAIMESVPRIVVAAFIVAALMFPVAMLLAFASLVVRFRSSTGDERLQLKWFVTAAGLVAVTLSLGFFVDTIAASVWASLALIYLDVAIAIAILKYRLYEIDVIIRKTIVYGALAAFITVVYVVVVVVIGAFIGTSRGLALIATAIVAVAFQPMRERAQRVANRLVYGKRATPYEVLSEFSEHVGETFAGEEILPRMARLLAEGTGASDAAVWLRVDSEIRPAASWPLGKESPGPIRLDGDGLPAFVDASAAVPVRHHGELLGALTLSKPPKEPLTTTEDKLVADLAAQAALVLANFRLIEDLRASRQRLVTAQDQERRKIERDLHDGAQQQLVALAVKARLAEAFVGKDTEREHAMLGELREGLTDALDTLRDLARGIYPPLLADRGLTAALDAQARKSALPVEVTALGIERYPQEAEAAVYFCSLEALQNVAKYAGASDVKIRLWSDGDELAFSVTDDGRGFDRANVSLGSGLKNMSDRLAALGGSLSLESEPGRGTTVTGRLPITVHTVT